MSITNEAKQEVERLLLAGQKLGAVKYLADTFGVNLLEAKALVEALETEMRNENRFSRAINSNAVTIPADLKTEVSVLLLENKKIEAIKRVHDELNVGLKTAKDIVDEIDLGVNPNRASSTSSSSRSGCSSGAKTFSVISGFIGFGLLGICALIYYFQEQTIANSEIVQGTVVNLRPSSEGDTHAPDIEYFWKNERYLYESSSYTSPSAFAIDEKVNLYVNRADPSDVVVDSVTERWLAILILGGIGAFFVFFSAIFFFARVKF